MGLSRGTGSVEMAGGISLGARRSIQFVKIGSSLYLLGVTDQQVNLIHIVHDPEEIESILTSHKSNVQEPFSTILRKLTGKTGKTQ
jgi:flagellar protein FliO/FliZ